MNDTELNRLIAQWLDGRIDERDSQSLQQQLRDSPHARRLFQQYTTLDAELREIASGGTSSNLSHKFSPTDERAVRTATSEVAASRSAGWMQWAIALSLLMVVGGTAYWIGKSGSTQQPIATVATTSDPPAEGTISGYATLRRVADLNWADNAKSYREGDVLPAGILQFDTGVAEIDFFCGATLVVEGPAKMDLESDWSVRMLAGRMRANVPPAARGFVVKAADSEIIDLGTEFALEVGPENARVEVIDGEIKLQGGKHDGNHLTTGQHRTLAGGDAASDSFQSLSTLSDVRRRHQQQQRERFQQWESYAKQLASDERLIAYYPIADLANDRVIPNQAASGSSFHGSIVGAVSHTDGRIGTESAGLEFSRPGSRVRTRIDGEFQAFTFLCWARIDSLAHVYNALFMADGYENGEPHWQIDNDGRLMFSVMVDDSAEVIHYSRVEDAVVRDAGRHRVYRTEPIWDLSKTGRWMQFAAVYDPASKRVRQYVDGVIVSEHEIPNDLLVRKLHIGPSEIGNWGQPFRKTPSFAVRNLNGAIDELAIYNAALTTQEIQTLYENGKP
ncbi:FecR protein domain protein [Rhodopirellula maiorica SM1]|uniref:FecR protein domain protein n=1 Tax=Rhodopirellula maiorica SM1 TaxID=1265738 RepID=M5S5M6_9BACT|nr:LamG-like jellyroll fold domain-containing protein [Rhodopirellula maiorica]EMI21499.1 FecR protein domain protein [Rhodopirellula maiorica SM1]